MQKFVGNVTAVIYYVMLRHLFHFVCNVVEVETSAHGGVVFLLQSYHNACLSLQGKVYGAFTAQNCVLPVGKRLQMSRRSCGKAELYCTCFNAEFLRKAVGKVGGNSAKLRVVETVFHSACADVVALCVPYSFGKCNKATPLFFVNFNGLLKKLCRVKGNFGKINQVGVCNHACGGKPTGISAHNFANGNAPLFVHGGVKCNFRHACRNKFRSRAVSRAMVRANQVVVHRFGYAYDIAWKANAFEIVCHLVACVHGVVASVVHKA